MANTRLTDLTAFSGTSINDNDEFWIDAYNSKTVTFTQANPGVFTIASHGLVANNIVVFSTTGTLPTNIVAGTNYYVISSGLTTNEFQISATIGGTAIDTTLGTVSGTHTATYYVSRKMSGLQMKSLLGNVSYTNTFTPGTAGVANTITHNLNTTNLVVELWDVTTGEQILTNINNVTSTTLDVTFTSNPSGNVKIVVLGNGSTSYDFRPYKVLTGLISQSGTSAPTFTVLENTLNEVPVASYTSAGNYALTFSSAVLTSNKSAVFYGDTIEAPKKLIAKIGSNTVVTLRSMNSSTYTDGYFSNTSIEIRVYN